MRMANPRPEKPKVVVDLGCSPDSRAGRLRWISLLDCYSWRKSFDRVDVGFLHPFEELPGVCGERLDVAPLAFGIDGVEGEGGFSGARRPGDDCEGAAGNFEVEALQVVLPRAANDDAFFHILNLFTRLGMCRTKPDSCSEGESGCLSTQRPQRPQKTAKDRGELRKILRASAVPPYHFTAFLCRSCSAVSAVSVSRSDQTI